MPVVKYGLLELTYAAVLLCFLALDPLYRNTLSKAFVTLGNIGFKGVSFIGIHVGGAHPFRFLLKLDEAIKTQISNGKAWAERGVVYSFNQLTATAALLVGVPLALGLALLDLTKWATHSLGKAVTHTVVQKIVQPVRVATKIVAQVTAQQFAHLTTRVATLEREVAHAAHATAGAIAQPFPRIKTVEHDLSALKHNYKKLAGLLTFAGAFALLVRAIGREMASLLKCGNVKKTAKEICHFDPRWLEALLGGFALIYVSEGLVPFARDTQHIIGDLAPAAQKFWKASTIGNGGDRALGSAGLN